MAEDSTEAVLLPHHEQLSLCSTRLRYRQGRKLTAVKVYTVNNESRHLLVFGVPSLDLRQETKALFSRFGKLQFNITKYPSEQFTETYHAIFENIQSARIAKKMLDTKNYYGGSLHVCYGPELENVNDTRQKLLLRQRSVVARLKNLQKPTVTERSVTVITPNHSEPKEIDNTKKLYMGEENSFAFGKRKTDYNSVKHCKLKRSRNFDRKDCVAVTKNDIEASGSKEPGAATNSDITLNTLCEVIDFTSAENDILTNINDSLNYRNFGNEVIKQIPYKPVNKIKFNLNKNS